MSNESKDFYKVLGVSESAKKDELKSAYRKLAKKYHPDANADNPKASDRFKEVGEAYSVLSDPAKRKKYDQMRRLGAFGIGTQGGGFRTSRAPGGGGPGDGGFSIDDLSGLGGLGDIFSSIFDRSKKAEGTKKGRIKGANVEYVVEVSFKRAVEGGKITITVPISEECATCGGDGAEPGVAIHRCGECRGSGTVSFGQGGFAVNRPCPACFGRGKIPESACSACGGTGTLRQKRKLQVNVPKGVESGAKVRVSGQGERGEAGGPPGDLVITFKVKEDPFFRRDGLDVHVTVPINLAQAMLGSRIRVRTPHGRKVTIRIPAGTQAGTKFRIRGQGIKKGDKVGDQYVEAAVEVPRDLSDDQKEVLEQFAESAGLKH